ncbi:MAG: hypothetical protein ABFS42_00065 [Candidatus Krumholzibacteriota bacterium]
MNLKFEISFRTLVPALVLAGLFGMCRLASAETVMATDHDSLADAYQDWISALEAAGGSNSRWEFPFEAPRPDNLSAGELETVLSLRRLVRDQDTGPLETLVGNLTGRPLEMPVQMRYWLAYAQSVLNRQEACWDNLRLLLLMQDSADHLEPGQRAWVLTAFADYSFLLGRRLLASRMYGQLAVSTVEQLELWGQYQLAGMDFLERNFNGANRRYKVVCESDKSGTWREHACAMAEMAARLDSLDLEGGSHGHVALVSP